MRPRLAEPGHGSWYYAASRQRFGCGAHVKVEANGKCVVVETDDYGPDVCVENAAHMPIINQLKAGQTPVQPFLGLSTVTLTPAIQRQLGLDVSFRTGDDSVAAQAMSPLLKLGALAASLPQAQLCVAGFADPRGSDAYNDELSLRRATNVAAVLTSAGVPRERIRIEGHGKTEAREADGDLDAYALERRVRVRLQLPETTEVAARD